MIQLDPMNILFSYFTSQCIFHGKPIQVLTHLRFIDSWIVRIMEGTIREQSIDSKF